MADLENKRLYPSKLVCRMAHMEGSLSQFLREKVIEKSPQIMALLEEKSKCLTLKEIEMAKPYLAIPLFNGLSTDMQLAANALVLEAEHKRELRHHIEANQKYTFGEPLFYNTDIPNTAVVYGGDLIDYKEISRLPNSNIVKIGRKFVYIDNRIPLVFYHWLEDCFPDSHKAVHLNPYIVSDTQPSQMTLECLIKPPKRDWWQTLNIYKGESQGCYFELLGNDDTNPQDVYDYSLGIRKFQVGVTRSNGGNLQMMIEELTQIYSVGCDKDCYMIGRMIHLDTDAERGTDFHKAMLNHIDLAENLYVGNDAVQRDANNLAIEPRTVDATYRTHLLRVDNIPFESIFKFAYAFFKSKQLVDEWKNAEFCEC